MATRNIYSRFVIVEEGVFPQEITVIGKDQVGIITDPYICYPQYGDKYANMSDHIFVEIGKFSLRRGDNTDRYGLPVIYGEIVLKGTIEDTRCEASRIYTERLFDRNLRIEQLYAKLSEESDRQSDAFKRECSPAAV